MQQVSSGEALARAMRAPAARRFRTGIHSIDSLTRGGPAAGHVMVIGAVSGGGKSSLARQLALEMSIDDPVLYVTLEETADEVLKSCGAKLAGCSVGAFERSQLDLLVKQQLDARMLFVFKPKSDMRINDFDRLMERTKAPIVILDHVRELDGWIADASGRAAGHTGPALISRRLKKAAEASGKLLIVLHQLNPPKMGQRRPGLFDLMDTKMLPQIASLVVLVWRPFADRGARADYVTELLVVKSRYGPLGTPHHRWVGETGMIWEFSPEEYEQLECCASRRSKAVAT